MSAGYQIRDQNGIYFITLAVVEWVDVSTRKDGEVLATFTVAGAASSVLDW